MKWDKIHSLKGKNENVTKYVFEKNDIIVESVIYKYPDYYTRTVICCSVQSGCPVGCIFCGTGKKFIRSLTIEEIIAQIEYILKDNNLIISTSAIKKFQIMFMSMGEPLLNREQVLLAITSLWLKYPNAELLISTMAPRVNFEPLFRLAEKISTIGIQFSIHASNDNNRKLLIPYTNKFNLDEISFIGEEWFKRIHRNPYFNYCVTKSNNSIQDADNLLKLFNPAVWKATVSVICNKDEEEKFNPDNREQVNDFALLLHNKGFDVRVFNPDGQDDIGAGCGQLWFVQDYLERKTK